MHFLNTMYLDLDSCADDKDLICDSNDSIFAIKHGRMHPMITILNLVELLYCLRQYCEEFIDMVYNFNYYIENITWNLIDLIMPTSFIIGWSYDSEHVANYTTRVSYTVTTISLLFVLLQQLRLTKRFSFMVLCIIACILKI